MIDPEGVLTEFVDACKYRRPGTIDREGLLDGFKTVRIGLQRSEYRTRRDLCDDFDPSLVSSLALFGASSRWIAAKTGWGRNRIARVLTGIKRTVMTKGRGFRCFT